MANMGVVSVYAMDIKEFILAKSKDPNKLNHFNLSVMVDDDFMNAVQNNETIFLHYPVYDDKGLLLKDPEQWKYQKEVDARELWDLIMTQAYNNGEPGIFFYDNMNKDNNLHYIENIVCSNPCSEYLAGTVYGDGIDPSKYGGACNLGSLMLHKFVKDPFTKNAYIDWKSIESTIKVAVRFLDNIIDINNFPDEIYKNYQEAFRTIGLGVTGLADMLVMLNIKYNTREARECVDYTMNKIALIAYRESIALAKTKGSFPKLDKNEFVKSGYLTKHAKESSEWQEIIDDIKEYGIRNSKIMSVAPCGTLSLVWGNNCSSGIEPIFAKSYDRTIKIGGQATENERVVSMRDYAYGKWLEFKGENVVTEDVFTTALEIDVNDHVDMLGVIAKHIDMSVSKTINVPTEYSFDEVKDIYRRCWMLGIKGCTIFRPNELRQGILTTESKDGANKVTQNTPKEVLKRGDILDVSEDLLGAKRKLRSGCGTMHFAVWFDEFNGEPYETFIDVGSEGGCERNLQFISRLMSASLRAGVPVEYIIDQAKSVKPCASYTSRRDKKGDTSKGSSCPSSIGFALEELYNKAQSRLYDNDEVLEHNEKLDDKPTVETIQHTSNNEPEFEICPFCGEKAFLNNGGCGSCVACGQGNCEHE